MLIYPDIYINNIKDITIDFLKQKNLKGLILDVDNTLINFDKQLLKRSKRMVRKFKKSRN